MKDFEKFINNRKVVLRYTKCLDDYNLDSVDAYETYYVTPTFDELLFGKPMLYKRDDHLIYRSLYSLTRFTVKFNFEFIDLIFNKSSCIWTVSNPKSFNYVNQLWDLRYDIARMDLDQLYHNCISDVKTQLRDFKKLGYNHLVAGEVIRQLDLLRRFAVNEFTEYDQAIKYIDGEEMQNVINDILNENIDEHQFHNICKDILKDLAQEYSFLYKGHSKDKTLYKKVQKILFNLIKSESIMC